MKLLFKLSIIIFLFGCSGSNLPNKVEGIPQNAFWKGTSYEGHWFTLKDFDNEKCRYRFKVYDEVTGEVVLDAYFKSTKECCWGNLDSLISKIYAFEDGTILINNKDCSLKYIAPAFGGSFWQIDRVKN